MAKATASKAYSDAMSADYGAFLDSGTERFEWLFSQLQASSWFNLSKSSQQPMLAG